VTGPSGRQVNPAISRVRMRRREIDGDIYFTVERRILNALSWSVVAHFPTRRQAQKYKRDTEAFHDQYR